MSRKIIIAVAPVAHMEKQIPSSTVNPVDPKQLADEVIKCAEAGASLAHLHVRNTTGKIVGELSTFGETIDMIRKKSQIIIQGSTGGMSTLTLDERSIAIEEPRVQMASLNMGSTNFGEGVYINTYSDIEFWANKMKKYNVVPELEVFDKSMIDTCYYMQEKGILKAPLHFNFSLGFKGAMAATPENLCILKQSLRPGDKWSFLHEGMEDFSMIGCALGLGASGIRVGYEDGFYYKPGHTAPNHELVAKAAELVRMMGFEVATIDEAYEILKMPRK